MSAPPPAAVPPALTVPQKILLHLGLDASPVGLAELDRAKSDVRSSLRPGIVTRSGGGYSTLPDDPSKSVYASSGTGASSLEGSLKCVRCGNVRIFVGVWACSCYDHFSFQIRFIRSIMLPWKGRIWWPDTILRAGRPRDV